MINYLVTARIGPKISGYQLFCFSQIKYRPQWLIRLVWRIVKFKKAFELIEFAESNILHGADNTIMIRVFTNRSAAI